jgi:hypothetical protein
VGWLPILISLVALAVSVTTAWLTFFRGGALRMTQPTMIYFGPDGDGGPSKVFLRTLLYSTARRGQTVESLHVNVQRGESRQNFSVWVYGQPNDLARGSGLFVPLEGVSCNHHFLLPPDGAAFPFVAGDYIVRVYARRVEHEVEELAAIPLRVSETAARELGQPGGAGIYFDWGPDQGTYHAHVRHRMPPSVAALMELAGEWGTPSIRE